jgi:hypothetical protein
LRATQNQGFRLSCLARVAPSGYVTRSKLGRPIQRCRNRRSPESQDGDDRVRSAMTAQPKRTAAAGLIPRPTIVGITCATRFPLGDSMAVGGNARQIPRALTARGGGHGLGEAWWVRAWCELTSFPLVRPSDGDRRSFYPDGSFLWQMGPTTTSRAR